MALAAVTASTNRSCTATLDAATEWSPWVYVHGNQEVDIILTGSTFTGTVKLERDRDGTNTDFVTDQDGADYAWTGDATPVLQMAVPAKYRINATAVSAGSMLVEIRAGNRD